MTNKEIEIINHYGVMNQLKYFQSEVFELNEAIIQYEYDDNLANTHIAEEMADVLVMLKQFQLYYGITDEEIEKVMNYKIDRQIKRMENE